MNFSELAALRKRALIEGYPPSIVARWISPSPPPALGQLYEPKPVDFEGVTRWVVGVCRPLNAYRIAQDLTVLGFSAYCPLERKVALRARLRGGRRGKRIYQTPVFGWYIFVGERGCQLTADVHEGVLGVLGNEGWPLAVPPASIKAISEDEFAGRWDETKRPTPPKGRGWAPLADLKAVLEASRSEMAA